jgi:hypothetical protein
MSGNHESATNSWLFNELPQWVRTDLSEGSGIDANPLNFRIDTGLARDRQGRKIIQVAPGPCPSEPAWLASISTRPSDEIARRLGITDRQVRRIKQGKVSAARLREHAKADPEYKKDDRRPCPTRARAAPLSLPGATDSADGVCRIAA